MQNKRNEMLEKLEQFKKLAIEIEDIWHNLDDDAHARMSVDYPFEKSFDEMNAEIQVWVERQKTLLNGINYKA